MSFEIGIEYRRGPFPGYMVGLRGHGSVGFGATIEAALDDLAADLEAWAADGDADPKYARRAEGELRSALAKAAERTEATLHPDDEPEAPA